MFHIPYDQLNISIVLILLNSFYPLKLALLCLFIFRLFYLFPCKLCVLISGFEIDQVISPKSAYLAMYEKE